VLTTTRERRSGIRKSEQFIVEVSAGNAASLDTQLSIERMKSSKELSIST